MTIDKFGENWFTYAEFYTAMVKHFASGSHFVEVGSHKGRSVNFLVQEYRRQEKNIYVDVVDRNDALINTTLVHNLQSEGTLSGIHELHFSLSCDAVKFYADHSVDFVMIDADNSYEGAKQNILDWLPKIKPHGIMAIQDYTEKQFGTHKAVDEVFSLSSIEIKITGKIAYVENVSW
jgi:hypothetical protein